MRNVDGVCQFNNEGSRFTAKLKRKKRRDAMKNYVSPVIFDNDELAEGVYATGSGKTCWEIGINQSGCQDNAGSMDGGATSYSVTEVWGKHTSDVYHISNGLTFEGELLIGPGQKVTKVECQDNVIFTAVYIEGATTFTVKRTDHANAYTSGDNPSLKIKVFSTTPNGMAPAKVLRVYNPVCDSEVNVQGMGAGGT